MLYRKSLSYACAALALSVSAGSALAADLPPPPPPPVSVIEEEGSCMYASIGGSYIIHERPRVYKNSAGPWLTANALGEDLDDTKLLEMFEPFGTISSHKVASGEDGKAKGE